MKDAAALGVQEIQTHELAPVFADDSLLDLFKSTHPEILPSGTHVNMVSFMDDVSNSDCQWLILEPRISFLSLDFARGKSLT